MIRIVPFAPRYADGEVSAILPIQRGEFDIPNALDAQPDLKQIPPFYRRGDGNFSVALDFRARNGVAMVQGPLAEAGRAASGASHARRQPNSTQRLCSCPMSLRRLP